MQPFSITKVILFVQNPKKCIEQESKQIWMEKSFHFIYFVCDQWPWKLFYLLSQTTNWHMQFNRFLHNFQVIRFPFGRPLLVNSYCVTNESSGFYSGQQKPHSIASKPFDCIEIIIVSILRLDIITYLLYVWI